MVQFLQLLSVSQGDAEITLGLVSWFAVCRFSLCIRVPLRWQGMGGFEGQVVLEVYKARLMEECWNILPTGSLSAG